METIRLPVREREERGDGPARRLRAQGLIPAVTYGKGKAPSSIVIALQDLKEAMAHGHNVVLELDFGAEAKGAKAKGKSKAPRYAVMKEIQIHPIKRYVQHVDLHEIDLSEEIEAAVPIEAVGTPAGIKDGGIVEWERREVSVKALPSDVPESLELEMSDLQIGQHLTVSALRAPKGVTIVDDPEAILVALVPPRVEQAAAAEGEEVAEPEVIGTEKTEE